MKIWTERIGIVVAAGALSMMLNAPPSRTQQLSPVAGGVPAGGIIFQTGACWEGWAEYTPARGRYVVGLVGGGAEAGTVGAALGDRESRATGAHSHGSGALSARYTRPTARYTRPTARYTRPTVTYRQPTPRYTRPRVNYTQPTATLTLPEVTYKPPTVNYTPQTVTHQHTHRYESMGPTISVDGGNDAAGRALVGADPHLDTGGQSDGPDVSDGDVTLNESSVSLSGGGVSLRNGSVSLSGGGVSLRDGSVSLSGGGVSLRDGSVSLSGGSVSLSGATGSAGRSVAAPYIQLRACRKL